MTRRLRLPPDEHALVRRELRRVRAYAAALLDGLSDADLERPPQRPVGACAKWHLGHVAFAQRQALAAFVPALRTSSSADVDFAPGTMEGRCEDYPTSPELVRSLRRTRRLVDALLESVVLDDAALEAFRQVVNCEYAQARFLRLRRQELGRSAVTEPSGRLVAVDTDCEAPPRFFLAGWEPARAEGASAPAEVVSLEDRRHRLAAGALIEGHEHSARGEAAAALRSYERAHGYEPSADALTAQAHALASLGDLDRAERLCLEAIALDPDFGSPYNEVGSIRLRRRDIPSAIQWFERAKRARRYEPRYFPFVNLGRLYMHLGMPEKALVEFEGALTFEPASSDIQATMETLRRQIEESP